MRLFQMSSWGLFLLVCTTNFKAITSVCLLNDYYIIRNLDGGLVLDTSNELVTLQYFTGSDAQLFKFECAGMPGIFNILSRDPLNYAVDVDTAGDKGVVVNKRDSDSLTQQWFVNSDGTMLNVGAQLCLDSSNPSDTIAPEDSLYTTECDSTVVRETWTLQAK